MSHGNHPTPQQSIPPKIAPLNWSKVRLRPRRVATVKKSPRSFGGTNRRG